MIGIVLIVIFDAKVVDTNTKFGSSGLVFPKTSGVETRFITLFFEDLYEIVIGENGGLFKPIHSFFNLDINKIISVY